MGITTQLDGIPAEGIGGLRLGVSPLELTDAYATLASGGVHHDPVAIEKVVFPNGHVDHPEGPKPERVLSRPVAWEVTRLLHDNITEGTGTAAYTGCAGEAGKTGTTDEYTDAWFAGYPPNLATAVWVGYPESNEIAMTDVHGITVFGGTFPAEIWHSLYTERRSPLRGIQRTRRSRSAGRPTTAQFTQARPRRPRQRGRNRRRRKPKKPAKRRPGQRRGRRLRPERLRARRRPGTGAAAAAAAAGGRRAERRLGGGEAAAAGSAHRPGARLRLIWAGFARLPRRAGRGAAARPAPRLGG